MNQNWLSFLEELTNPEKTRLINRFQNYSLEPFAECLEKLGILSYPDHQPIRISIVGTNGKGSLGHYLSEILKHNSVNVGYYSSPHFFSALERIRVNGETAEEKILDEIFTGLGPEMRKYLSGFSYFEVFTAFAILYFRLHNTDWEIYEAGLGGRLDATKLTNPHYVVVTKIGLDHTEILGDTTEAILQEKLGIVGENTKKIYASKPDRENEHLESIFVNYAKEKNLEWEFFPELDRSDFRNSNINYLEYYKSMSYWILEDIQRQNPVYHSKKWILPLEMSPPMGRLEVVSREPFLVYDTAHNPDATQHFMDNIDSLYPNLNWEIIIGSLPDKDLWSMIRLLNGRTNIYGIHILDFPPFSLPSFKAHTSESAPNASPESDDLEKQEFDSRKLCTIMYSEESMRERLNYHRTNGIHTLVIGSFRIYPILTKG